MRIYSSYKDHFFCTGKSDKCCNLFHSRSGEGLADTSNKIDPESGGEGKSEDSPHMNVIMSGRMAKRSALGT